MQLGEHVVRVQTPSSPASTDASASAFAAGMPWNAAPAPNAVAPNAAAAAPWANARRVMAGAGGIGDAAGQPSPELPPQAWALPGLLGPEQRQSEIPATSESGATLPFLFAMRFPPSSGSRLCDRSDRSRSGSPFCRSVGSKSARLFALLIGRSIFALYPTSGNAVYGQMSTVRCQSNDMDDKDGRFVSEKHSLLSSKYCILAIFDDLRVHIAHFFQRSCINLKRLLRDRIGDTA